MLALIYAIAECIMHRIIIYKIHTLQCSELRTLFYQTDSVEEIAPKLFFFYSVMGINLSVQMLITVFVGASKICAYTSNFQFLLFLIDFITIDFTC